MESLQKKVSDVPVAREKIGVRTETKPLYDGLRLVENIKYAGGTSIRYWM